MRSEYEANQALQQQSKASWMQPSTAKRKQPLTWWQKMLELLSDAWQASKQH